MTKKTSITETVEAARWPIADSDFALAWTESDTKCVGNATRGSLLEGLAYQFFGDWQDDPTYGRQFRFTHCIQQQPHNRRGLVKYLERHAPNVGPKTAGELFDAFGSDAVKVLRTQPSEAAKVTRFLTPARAKVAAAALQVIADLEDTKIELTNLFAGRGFPGRLTDEVVAKWNILAPARIKRDPFTLLVHGFNGCGFARCDRLYMDLGLEPTRLKRQVICLWNVLVKDTSGHTWLRIDAVATRLGEMVGGVNVNAKKAIRLGIRSRMLVVRQDDKKRTWLAEGSRARDERRLSRRIKELIK